MRRKIAGMIAISACAVGAYGQEAQDGLKKHSVHVMAASSAPVTESEAREVFARAEHALRRSLGMSQSSAVTIPAGNAPVRRGQVVEEMARIYGVIKPKIKMTPAPTKYDPSVLKMAKSSDRATLDFFVRMGAIARVGPLATGPSDSLTVPQFGDALGFFLARMAELTHLPNSKWTPELEAPGT